MNEKVNDFAKSPEDYAAPAAILVLDKDGNPIPVEVLGPNEVQDIEYSDDKNGN